MVDVLLIERIQQLEEAKARASNFTLTKDFTRLGAELGFVAQSGPEFRSSIENRLTTLRKERDAQMTLRGETQNTNESKGVNPLIILGGLALALLI